jgi:hypothetical protein
MDIRSNGIYPSNILSNFAHHHFIIDDIECNSYEGFLQSLKFKSVETQKNICKLIGSDAKKKGYNKKWYKTQILYWKNKEIKRDSNEYQELLDKVYNALYKNSKLFRKALAHSVGVILTHTMGKNNKNETILTTQEFCSRLMILRDYGIIKREKI